MDQSPSESRTLIPVDDGLNHPVSSVVPPAVILKEGNDFGHYTEFFTILYKMKHPFFKFSKIGASNGLVWTIFSLELCVIKVLIRGPPRLG